MNFYDFIRFNRHERLAVYITLPLLIAIAFLSRKSAESSELILDNEEWLWYQGQIEEYGKQLIVENQSDFFDPNSLDSAAFVKLGLSPKQASVIIKFREKNEGFYAVSDLLECKYIPEDWVIEHEEFFQFGIKPENDSLQSESSDKYYKSDTPKPDYYTESQPSKKAIQILDLNTCDSAALEALPGIGAGMAGRIIKFRTNLGGFINKNQLLEIYGMKEDNYLKFIDLVNVSNSFQPKKLCINSCTKEELMNHPYIEPRLAGSLINIREQHGPYKNPEGIRFSVLLNDSIYERIRPYISICAEDSERSP